MKRFALAAFAALMFALPAFAQDQLQRLTALESQFAQFAADTTASINGMAAINTRIQADVKSMKEDLAAIKEQLAAPKPQTAATAKMVWQPATSAWGPGSVGKWVSADDSQPADTIMVSQPMMMSGYGSSSMMGSRRTPIRSLFSRGAGSCSSGSCR